MKNYLGDAPLWETTTTETITTTFIQETDEKVPDVAPPVSKPEKATPTTPTEQTPEPVPENVQNVELEETKDALQRLNAEYVNYRKRVERDRDVARSNTLFTVFNKILPTLDSIVAARKFGDLEEGSPFAAIAANMETVLTDLGLERIDAVDVPFDPTKHEAVLRQPNDEIPEDYVSQVFREGYVFGERVVRATQVMVSAGPTE